MTEYYCFEQGNCRGHEFTNKFIFDKEQFIEAAEASMTAISTMNNDEKFDYLDEISSKFDSLLLVIVSGSAFIEDDHKKVNERLQQIKDNQSFQVECEESVLGFASTKKDARSTAYVVDIGEDEW